MKKNKLISFIMPNYNNEHVLDLFFKKFIKNNTYENYEMIICDDGSLDHSLDKLKYWKDSNKIKNMKIIEEGHKGIVNALNKCLEMSKGDFIIRLDGDATIETKGFVEKFLDFYNIAPEKIGVITSKVIIDNGRLHAIGRDVISEKGLHDRGKDITEEVGKRTFDSNSKVMKSLVDIMNVPAEIDTALGVCSFCRRDDAVKIGGFDKNYPLWTEDDDFYLSFRKLNKKVFYLPNIQICHRFSLRGDRNPSSWKGQEEKHDKNWRQNILTANFKYWEEKWGFNPLNPDMEALKKKYKGSELVWNYDEKMKSEGEAILKEYNQRFDIDKNKLILWEIYIKIIWLYIKYKRKIFRKNKKVK